MYSVTDLAKMYKCSRQTIYVKFALPELKPYIITDTHGKNQKLTAEGLNSLNTIIVGSKLESKIKSNQIQEESIVNKPDTDNLDKLIIQYELNITELRNQVEYFKGQTEKLQVRNDMLISSLMERKTLLEDAEAKGKRTAEEAKRTFSLFGFSLVKADKK